MSTYTEKYTQMMQESTELKTDALIIKRLLKRNDEHPNSLVQRIRQYSEDLSWDGSEGSALYGKVASAMMSDGFGTPRDNFPDIYLEVLNEREGMKQGYSVPTGVDGNNPQVVDAIVADQQFSEVDSRYKSLDARLSEMKESPDYQDNLERHGVDGVGVAAIIGDGSSSDPDQAQAIGARRLGQVLSEMAQQIASKVVDTMVALDNKVDAVAAKGRSAWNSVTEALASKKTKIAALTVAGLVAAGISSLPAQAADVEQANTFTQAEMTDARHQDREAFYNHLASQRETLDMRYAYNVLHNPSFRERVLDTPSGQDSLMELQEVRDALTGTPEVQEFLLGLSDNDDALNQILEDEDIKRRVTELPAFEAFLSEVPGVNSNLLEVPEVKEKLFNLPEVRERLLSSPEFREQVLSDSLVQEKVLDMPDFRRQAFSVPEAKERVLAVEQMHRALLGPEIEYRVIRDIEQKQDMDLPPVEQRAPNLASVEHDMDVPSQVTRETNLSYVEHDIDVPTQVTRETNLSYVLHDIDLPERKERTPNVPEPKTHAFNAEFLKLMDERQAEVALDRGVDEDNNGPGMG